MKIMLQTNLNFSLKDSMKNFWRGGLRGRALRSKRRTKGASTRRAWLILGKSPCLQYKLNLEETLQGLLCTLYAQYLSQTDSDVLIYARMNMMQWSLRFLRCSGFHHYLFHLPHFTPACQRMSRAANPTSRSTLFFSLTYWVQSWHSPRHLFIYLMKAFRLVLHQVCNWTFGQRGVWGRGGREGPSAL